MIITLLISVILNIISAIFFLLPEVSIASIPYFGEEVRNTLIWAIQTWNAFMLTFPYAETAWHMFLWVVVPFELLLLIGKFLLGHRLPAQNNN